MAFEIFPFPFLKIRFKIKRRKIRTAQSTGTEKVWVSEYPISPPKLRYSNFMHDLSSLPQLLCREDD